MYNSEPKDLNHPDRTQLLRLTNDVKQMDILSDKDESFCQCQTYPLVAKAKKKHQKWMVCHFFPSHIGLKIREKVTTPLDQND